MCTDLFFVFLCGSNYECVLWNIVAHLILSSKVCSNAASDWLSGRSSSHKWRWLEAHRTPTPCFPPAHILIVACASCYTSLGSYVEDGERSHRWYCGRYCTGNWSQQGLSSCWNCLNWRHGIGVSGTTFWHRQSGERAFLKIIMKGWNEWFTKLALGSGCKRHLRGLTKAC